MTATKATEKVICEIKTVNWPLLEGNPIKWLEEIKNSNNDSPNIISGITKGEELKKIRHHKKRSIYLTLLSIAFREFL